MEGRERRLSQPSWLQSIVIKECLERKGEVGKDVLFYNHSSFVFNHKGPVVGAIQVELPLGGEGKIRKFP